MTAVRFVRQTDSESRVVGPDEPLLVQEAVVHSTLRRFARLFVNR